MSHEGNSNWNNSDAQLHTQFDVCSEDQALARVGENWNSYTFLVGL